jgi:hypothetical protein
MSTTGRLAARVRQVLLADHAPLEAIAAVQPYSTVDGHALTVQFHYDPDRFAFQSLPLRTPGLTPLYQRLILDRFSKFLMEPRMGTNRQSYSAPEDTLAKIGSLNTEYTTMHDAMRELHPAWGSVELVQPGSGNLAEASRVGLAGLNVSLWDASYGLISSSLLTGAPPAEVRQAQQQFRETRRLMDAGQLVITMPPETGADWDAFVSQCRELTDAGGGGHVGGSQAATAGEPCLIGPLRTVGEGFAQHVAFPHRGGGRDRVTGHALEVVPPWQLDVVLARVATRLCDETSKLTVMSPPDVVEEGPASRSKRWDKVTVNTAGTLPLVPVARNLQVFELDAARPVTVAMAFPRSWPYGMDAWPSKLGEPAVRDLPIFAVKLKLIQDGAKVGGGTVAFSPLRL